MSWSASEIMTVVSRWVSFQESSIHLFWYKYDGIEALDSRRLKT